jgi:hypothetical protein
MINEGGFFMRMKEEEARAFMDAFNFHYLTSK